MTDQEYTDLFTKLVTADLPGHDDDTQDTATARMTAAIGGQKLFYERLAAEGMGTIVCHFDAIGEGSVTIVEGAPSDDDERDALRDDLESRYADAIQDYINSRKEATTRSWHAGRGSDDRSRTLTSWLGEDGWYACFSGETVQRLGWETDDIGPYPTRKDAHEAALDDLQGREEDTELYQQYGDVL